MSVGAAVNFGLFILIGGAVAAFGYAFRSTGTTRCALARIEARAAAFRAAFLPLLLGAAISAEAEAVLWRTGLPRDHPAFLLPSAVGLVMVLAGLVGLDLVLWWPTAEESTPGPTEP